MTVARTTAGRRGAWRSGAASSAQSTASATAGSINWLWSGHDRRLDDLDRFASLGHPHAALPGVVGTRGAAQPRRTPTGVGPTNGSRPSRSRHTADRRAPAPRQRARLYLAARSSVSPTSWRASPARSRERYPWMSDFTPVNEPLTTARSSGLYGHWYPHGRCDRDFVRALLNQLRGVVLAMRAIRDVVRPRA